MSSNSAEVFSDIAGRYDRLNSILSLGRDQAWRRRALDRLPEGRILDLGAGTGAANAILGSRRVVALDPSPPMLALNDTPHRVVGVAEALPFRDATFDAVLCAYVFRNLESVEATLGEIHRVLRVGGRAGIVDLARPEGDLARRLHRMGTSIVLPLAGAAIGARPEYTYLHHSLDQHPAPDELLALSPLRLVDTWRMGPMGFVWGAVLEKK
jgi:demethylmenaquinone methyltransferase/2-methoxy-6-polyprenyl-1,4-benzoquinol methylase